MSMFHPRVSIFAAPVLLLMAGSALMWARPSFGQDGAALSGDPFTLFNPQPRDLWRPMSADRPDITESPNTVPAGAVQIEASFFDYAKNGGDRVLTIAPINLKLGLSENTDLQFVFDPYVDVDPDGASSESGFGDMQIRLKYNLFGNDDGDEALALLPFIKLPTADDPIGNEEVEGGIAVPFSRDLGNGVGLGLMGELDFVYDGTDDDYDLEFLHTVALGFELSGKWGCYAEYAGVINFDGEDYRALIGGGVTYSINENFSLDGGVNFGLTGDADDVNLFAGFTYRF